MTDYTNTVDELVEQLSEHDIEVDEDDIHERLSVLCGEYSIPVSEAHRSIISSYAEKTGKDIGPNSGGPTEMDIGDVTTDTNWVTVEGTVTTLWDNTHETIKQGGRIGDETGTINFTNWESAEAPLLEEDKAYRLDNVGTDEYQGQYQLNFTEYTEVTELDQDIEAKQNTETFVGALVDIKSGSGLIKRCPEDGCSRVVQNGRCAEHGDVDGEFDLRIKAVFDDGTQCQDVLFNRESTEAITGTTLEAAMETAQKMLDTTVIADEFADQLAGRYFEVEGPKLGRYLLANEFEELSGPDAELVSELQARVRAL